MGNANMMKNYFDKRFIATIRFEWRMKQYYKNLKFLTSSSYQLEKLQTKYYNNFETDNSFTYFTSTERIRAMP